MKKKIITLALATLTLSGYAGLEHLPVTKAPAPAQKRPVAEPPAPYNYYVDFTRPSGKPNMLLAPACLPKTWWDEVFKKCALSLLLDKWGEESQAIPAPKPWPKGKPLPVETKEKPEVVDTRPDRVRTNPNYRDRERLLIPACIDEATEKELMEKCEAGRLHAIWGRPKE